VTGSDSPSDNDIAAFLLAIEESLPGLSRQIMNEASASGLPGHTLDDLLAKPNVASCPGEFDRLNAWLNEGSNAAWRQVPSDRLAAVAEDVRRFLFQSVPGPG
jgi:hypothetical protein